MNTIEYIRYKLGICQRPHGTGRITPSFIPEPPPPPKKEDKPVETYTDKQVYIKLKELLAKYPPHTWEMVRLGIFYTTYSHKDCPDVILYKWCNYSDGKVDQGLWICEPTEHIPHYTSTLFDIFTKDVVYHSNKKVQDENQKVVNHLMSIKL